MTTIGRRLKSCLFMMTIVMVLLLVFIPADSRGMEGGGLTAPVAPAQVTADAGNQRVTLSWTPVSNATSYNIYVSTVSGPTKANAVNKIEATRNPHAVRDLSNGTPYYFVVTAVNAAGESTVSKQVSAVPSPDPPPPAPKDVVAEPQDGAVRISWSPSAGATSRATSYDVYYSTEPGAMPKSAVRMANATSPQIVAPLKRDILYYFVVTASNEYGESTPSFEVKATPAPAAPPLAPTGVTAIEGDGMVTVSWQAVPGANSYNLYYSTQFPLRKPSATKLAGIIAPGPVVSTTLKDLSNKTAYFFVVTALKGASEGAESRRASATPIAPANRPVPPSQRMVLIPAGPFVMGDSLDKTPYAQPVHTVNLDAFYIDKYETTYDLWKEVYDWAINNGYSFNNPGTKGSNGMGTNMPVTLVNWYDVVKWLNARSEKEGRTPVYYTDSTQTTIYRKGKVDLDATFVKWSANGFRLPTEAEWEKAGRGGLNGMRYPWGNDPLEPQRANLGFDRQGRPQSIAVSVGLYPANGYGLYDMAGNVTEWVFDRGAPDCVLPASCYNWATDGMTNPSGPDTGSARVRRGGCYTEGRQYLKVFEREFRIPVYIGPYFGFRSASSRP